RHARRAGDGRGLRRREPRHRACHRRHRRAGDLRRRPHPLRPRAGPRARPADRLVLYLDHAATSPVRPEVLEAMRPYLTDVFGNPSSHHTAGEAAAAALQEARERVAAGVGMRAADIVFTSGGTEANNLAVKGIVLGAVASQPGRRHLMTTPLEHESVLESADHLHRLHGVDVTLLPVDEQGLLHPHDLEAALRDETALVSFAHAN